MAKEQLPEMIMLLLTVIGRGGITVAPSPILSLNPERKMGDHLALFLAFYLASWGM